jgi:hypothetical protein
MLTESILTVAVPVFVTVSVWVALVPTETFPNVRLAALGVRIPAPGEPGLPPPGVLALVYPAQLERPMTARMAARASSWAIGDL